MSTAQFVDVSSYQSAINFHAYAAWARQWDTVARIAMKATEGVGYTNPVFVTGRPNALGAGIGSILYYHFARPDLHNTPEAEANYLYSVVGAIRDTDTIVLDYEVDSPLATAEWAYRWLAAQEKNYKGKLPAIYASSAYIQQRLQDNRLAKYPLWLANWQFNPDARPPCPLPWQRYTWLQFTDKAGGIPGIGGAVDCNIFLGGTHTPMGPNKWQIADAEREWKSTSALFGGTAPTYTSGIAEMWRDHLYAGSRLGPPLSQEYDSADWGGNPIKVQQFAHARCEWRVDGTSCRWFDARGEIE